MADHQTQTVDVNRPGASRAEYSSDRQWPACPPCAIVIFGGGGDLSHRKLLPALYNLLVDGQLPECMSIVAFSLEDLDDEKYRLFARDGIARYSRRKPEEKHWGRFAALLRYVRGNFKDLSAYQELKRRLAAIDQEAGTASNRVFYFAIPPTFVETCAAALRRAEMIATPAGEERFTRVVIEKPIGHDRKSAAEINDRLARYFHEDQIFRIDHYLGKETVENLMVLRFANAIFEPLWNAKFIDHVQITVAESDGVGTRASYYEHAGALRDMVQSHLLQVLCLVAMEPPRTTAANSVRDAKLGVLRTLRPYTDEDVAQSVVRAQYAAGTVDGQRVPGYRQEEHVAPDSVVETFVALKCWIDNWRWAGVPFYLRTGKRMTRRASEIAIEFNAVPRVLFNARPHPPLTPNMLIVRIQPDEGLSLHVISKIPGSGVRLAPVKVDFHYATATPEAYETLLRDVILGDQTLFMRCDNVEAAWQFIQPILDVWARKPAQPPLYLAGSCGPQEADLIAAADGRRWRML